MPRLARLAADARPAAPNGEADGGRAVASKRAGSSQPEAGPPLAEVGTIFPEEYVYSLCFEKFEK